MALPPLARGRWASDVYDRLVALLEAPHEGPRHVALDWDDTLLEGDCSLHLLRTMDAARGTVWFETYFEQLAAHGRAVAYPLIAQWWAGTLPHETTELLARIGSDAFDHGVLRFRAEMEDLCRALQARGWTVWVVTASPGLLVAPLAARLGIPRERVLGMYLRVGADGRFTEEVIPPVTWGEGKWAALSQRIDGPLVLAAGDSASDAPMMRAAQHALLLDGHDAALREEARAAGWMIQPGWTHTEAEPGVESHDG